MQGKALAALLVLLGAVLLAGCGGGESQSTGSTAPAQSAGEEAQAPAAVEKLQRDTERVRAQREQKETPRAPAQAGSGPGGGQAQGQPQPPAAPQDTHHDSGGGAAQFTAKGGDNSIQESGQEASEAELHAAAAVLHAYLDARVAHRWNDACFYLSASVVTAVEEFTSRFGKDKGIESCPEVLEALSEGSGQGALEEAAKADVGSLRLDGDRGFLLYRGAGGVAYAILVVEEGGAWKVGTVDGTGV